MIRKIIDTKLGKMTLVSDGTSLIASLFLYEESEHPQYAEVPIQDDAILQETEKQLNEYFKGERKSFDLPLKIEGTDFQKSVWHTLQSIPYGKVLTYKEIAEKVNSPKAFRAAGGACRANRHLVIVPCHRVLGTNGSYTGFAGDKIYMKKALLQLEAELIGEMV